MGVMYAYIDKTVHTSCQSLWCHSLNQV